LNEPSKLIEKILSDAKAVADAEQQNANEKAAEIIEKAEHKANDRREEAKANAKTEAEARKKRIQSVYDLEHKKDVLAMKRDVLDTAFAKAVTDILALPDAQYAGLMTRLLVECAETGEGEICVANADKNRLDSAFLSKANAALKAKAGKGDVVISQTACNKQGGFIYRKGGMEVDCSVEAVVALEREKMETDVAAILFPAQGE